MFYLDTDEYDIDKDLSDGKEGDWCVDMGKNDMPMRGTISMESPN